MMKKLILPFFINVLFLPLFAAAPAMHVYCAELYLKKYKPHYTKKEWEAFIVGTLFPDIRYLARISRAKTHSKKVKLEDIIKTENSFTAGKLFHSYVDEQRELVARREKIYDLVVEIPRRYKSRFVKVVEDELCYNLIHASDTLTALNNIDKEESRSGIAFHTIRAWHKHIKAYLKQSPLALFKGRTQAKRGYYTMGADTVKNWHSLIEHYVHNGKMTDYYSKLIAQFDQLLSKK